MVRKRVFDGFQFPQIHVDGLKGVEDVEGDELQVVFAHTGKVAGAIQKLPNLQLSSTFSSASRAFFVWCRLMSCVRASAGDNFWVKFTPCLASSRSSSCYNFV